MVRNHWFNLQTEIEPYRTFCVLQPSDTWKAEIIFVSELQ